MKNISSSPTFGCGYVDRRNKVVGYQQCSKDLDGFICQNKGKIYDMMCKHFGTSN